MVTKLINAQPVTTNGINNSNTKVNLSGAYLYQNAPNPYNNSTIIIYHLPQTAGSALLKITNMKGQVLKSVPLGNKGNGKISLYAGSLAAGSYVYTLWVDGKQLDSKQMLIVNK